MDERDDMVRAIRDEQYRYVRNYSPHRPWGQPYSYPFQVLPSMRSWHAAYQSGKCNDVQARYWQPKPPEELYEVAADPFEIHNRVGDADQAARLDQMRTALRAQAARRGLVIPAAAAGKHKMFTQSIFIGSLLLWYALDTLARDLGWTGGVWRAWAVFHGSVVALSLALAVVLTVYSMMVYRWAGRKLMRGIL
jgi:hypothetical protein